MGAGTTQRRGTSREGHRAERRSGWIGKRKSRATQQAGCTARLMTAIAMFVMIMGIAGPAAADVLVSNIEQTSVGSGPKEKLAGQSYAMPFTTGSNASGYILDSISIKFENGSRPEGHPLGDPVGDPVYVYLYGDNGRGRPNHDSQVAVLTKAGTNFAPPTNGVNKYLTGRANNHCCPRPRPVHLNSTTQYWVYIWAGSSTSEAQLDRTSLLEDAGGAAGWSIGDSGFIHPDGTTASAYTSTGSAAQIKVEGTPNPEVLISISDATATEGVDETADFVVTLNRKSSGTVTVDYLTTWTVSATPGVDYQDVSGTLTFRPGETSKIISVPIIDDTVNDSGETFGITLFDAIGADIDDGQGTGTILNTEVLTGSFENVPQEHDGSTPFTFDAVFNSDIGISYATLRDHSFTVTNGKVTRARRNNGRNDSWEITVTPWGNDAVTVTLPGNRDCGTTAAICTKEDHPVQLSNSPSATVAGPPGVSTVPVTASFSNMPTEHNGSTFTFDLSFSENVAAGYARIRDHAFSVNGANITKAQRKTQGSNQNWTVTVDPTGNGGVSITLPETTNCSNAGAICTDDGRKLNHSTSDSVQGPVGISVSDARVEEAAGAVLAFAVTLSRSASSQITINYATSDGSATAGADYTAASGILTIESGSSSGSIEVTVLDDSHNDGEETLTLSNASSGVLTDATATGTIENHDAMPRALIARFGRTAAVHIVEQVEERVNAPRRPGFDGRVAGREINGKMGREFALDFLQQLGGQAGYGTPMPGTAGQQTRQPGAGGSGLGGTPLNTPGGGMNPAMGGLHSGGMEQMHGDQAGQYGMGMGFHRDSVLSGSEFALNRATSSGGILSFWSRSAQSQFHGRDGVMALNGDVRTTMFGADYSKGRMVTGVSLSHSRGLGNYASVDSGRMTSAVTGLYPWIGYKASDRITVWTVAGYGAGGLLLNPGAGPAIETGLSMAMAAGGGRGQILGDGNGFGLAFKADALWVGTHTKAVNGPGGRLAATDAAVNRLRTALEGSHTLTIGNRMALTPSVEVGIRQDGGDAETGTGMDVGAGLVFADAVTGLSVDVRVRRLVVHQADGFAEHGMSISVSYNPTPTTPLGFTARVSPAWGGDALSGAEALWGRESMGGMGHESVMGSGGNRLDTEVGYGLPIGSRFVGTPRASVRTSEYGRDYRIGYGVGVLEQGRLNLQIGVDAERRESALFQMQEQGAGTDQRVLGRATVQW